MIQYPNIDPIALDLGVVKVHWYGVMYLVGFTLVWYLGNYRCRLSKGEWTKEQLSDIIFFGAVGVLLGGRFGYVLFYQFDYFLQDPLWLFKIWQGGMSFHGGLLGVGVALYVFSKKWKKAFFDVTDFVAPLVPLALGAGRIGNFIGGELWGRVTSEPWGMVFPNDPLQLPRHPSQLYQFALEGVLLFIILWLFSSKPRPQKVVTGAFLLGYGILRSIAEFFRQPDQQIGFIFDHLVTMGQLLSLPMIVCGVIFIYWNKMNQLSK